MTKLLLSMMPSFQSVNLLVPHLGNACIKAYVNEKMPHVVVNTLDLRPYSLNKDIWGPEYTPQITSKYVFVSDIYELPLIASLITRFNKNKTLSELLKNDKEVIEDWAFERTILPEIVEEKLNKTHEFALKYISKFGGYDIVGFSLYISNIYFSIFMALLIKITYPKTKIIFGGPQITQSPSTRELLIKSGVADALVLGEGEEPVVQMIKSFEENISFDDIIGVKTINNFEKPDTYSQTSNVQELPTPNYEGMPFESFKNKAIPVYANRGCTFRCHFCSEHSLFGKNFKRRTPEQVVNDMLSLSQKHNINVFYFCDSLLNAEIGDDWLDKFVDLLLLQEQKFHWYARFRAEMDEKIISKLAKSGLVTAAMGVESFSQNTLDKMNKKKEEDFIISTITSLINNGVKASINLLVGYPEETKDNFITTLKVTDKVFDRFRDENKGHLFRMTIRNFELRPFSTTYNYFKKFGIEAETWSNKYSEKYYSKEFKNIFDKTLYTFKVTNVPIDETINRLALMNQVKNKDSFIESKNRMLVSVMDTYNHFDE